MPMVPSDSGFLLLDAELNLIASNDPALQILCFPSEASRIKQPKVLVADRVRTTLLDHRHRDRRSSLERFSQESAAISVRPFKSTTRTAMSSPQPAFAVLLERGAAVGMTPSELFERFSLTHRECETVEYLCKA